jgi:hypothetical protein
MTHYQPSTSDRLIDDAQFPDEPDAREQAQLLDQGHADRERDLDAQLSDPAYLAWIESQAAAYLNDGEAA